MALSYVQRFALQRLYEHSTTMSNHSFPTICISGADGSRVMRSLEKKGLVQCFEGSRPFTWRLTERGSRVAEEWAKGS